MVYIVKIVAENTEEEYLLCRTIASAEKRLKKKGFEKCEEQYVNIETSATARICKINTQKDEN